MCNAIAKFYVKIAHLFACISMTINPRYTYVDSAGREITVPLSKKKEIPIQCSMGGGYSKDIKTIVNAHSNTFKMANEIFT